MKSEEKKVDTAGVSQKLSAKEVSTILSVSVHQVRIWANEGVLRSYRLSPHILRFELEDVLRFLNESVVA